MNFDHDTLEVMLLAATVQWTEHKTISHCAMVNRTWKHLCDTHKTQEYRIWVRKHTPTCIPKACFLRVVHDIACAQVSPCLWCDAPRWEPGALALLHVELEKFAVELLAGEHPLAKSIMLGQGMPYHPDLFPTYLEPAEPGWVGKEGDQWFVPCHDDPPPTQKARNC